MSLPALLIHRCDIQKKTIQHSSYERIEVWSTISADVPTRKDSDNTPRIYDEDMRTNIDDDLFFFLPNVIVERGNRIVFEGDNYDVIKVNKLYDATSHHHTEVRARLIDSD